MFLHINGEHILDQHSIIFKSKPANLLLQSLLLLAHLPVAHAYCVTERENVFQTTLHIRQHFHKLPELYRGETKQLFIKPLFQINTTSLTVTENNQKQINSLLL